MVGPFMQGMLLMGVIYWYSKGMLNLINDYYRVEFQKQLKANATSRESHVTDEIQNLLTQDEAVNNDNSKPMWSSVNLLSNDMCQITHKSDVCFDETELHKFLEIALSVCFVNYSDLDKAERDTNGCHKNTFVPTNDT